MITANRKRIKKILEWLKAELESHYEFQKSSLKPYRHIIVRKTRYRLIFESAQLSLDIWYWNTGVINLIAFDKMDDDLFMYIHFEPDYYFTDNYPIKSEIVFREKIKELLTGLHHKNRNIPMNLPADI